MPDLCSQVFEASPQQAYLWSLGSPALPPSRVVARLEDAIDVERLRAAVAKLVRRYEILRTRCAPGGQGRTVQIVDSGSSIELAQTSSPDTDWPDQMPPARDTHCAHFELVTGRGVQWLVLEAPAVQADFGSMQILLCELALLYDGREAVAETLQWADFAGSQLDAMETDVAAGGRQFWARVAARGGAELPIVRSDGEPAGSFDRIRRTFPCDALASLLDRSPDEVEAVAATLWAAVLQRFTPASEVLLGWNYSGRDKAGAMVGPCEMVLPVHLQVDFQDSLEDAARITGERLRDAWYWAFAYEPTSQKRSIPTSFRYSRVDPRLGTKGTPFCILESSGLSSRSPLQMVCRDTGVELHLELWFEEASVKRAHAELFLERFQAALEAAASNPTLSIGDVARPSTGERERLLQAGGVNGTTASATAETILSRFDESVRLRPGSAALADADREWTFSELDDLSNRIALRLREMGARPGCVVALVANRKPAAVAAILGILKSGAAYLPVDPSQPRERLLWILQDAGAELLVTAGALESCASIGLPRLDVIEDASVLRSASPERIDVAILPEHLAYVIYTSGSTGAPKAVGVEHRQLASYVHALMSRIELEPGLRFAMVSTFAADLGHTVLFPSLCSGGVLHLLSEDSVRDDRAFQREIEARRIDVLKITPSHLASLTADTVRLPAKHLILGGEACGSELVSRWLGSAPALRIWNHYGPTECTVGAICDRVTGSESQSRGSLTLGAPLDNSNVHILDEDGELCGFEIGGEICIGGFGVARGYRNRADLTAGAFVPDPFSRREGARLYRTGDRARRRIDGRIEFLGRLDDQIKLRGYRVEPGEIAAILSGLEAVRQATVMLREDSPGVPRLVAYAVAKAGCTLTPDAILAHLADRLPDYMVPAAVVILNKFPVTTNGKLDRNRLPAPEPQPDGTKERRTWGEELLAGIWEELLGMERAGVEDNFFQAGGHSLLATQLVSRVRKVFDVEIPVRAVFENPRLGSLAARIVQARDASIAGAVPVPTTASRQGRLPLSFAQQRLWFLDQLHGPTGQYNLPAALELTGPLNVTALRRAMAELIVRHESLRTVFPSHEGQPLQEIVSPLPQPLPLVDLAALKASDRTHVSAALVSAEAVRPFDLAKGPLLRPILLRMEPSAHIFTFSMHHIISDGWSRMVLSKELSALYDAFGSGAPSPLAPLELQYADFALWQRNWLAGDVLRRQLDYWRATLESVPPLELPTDGLRLPLAVYRAASEKIALGAELTASLRELSQSSGCTLFMTLLAAFDVVLSRYSGQTVFIVGTDIAGRNHLSTEKLVGFFVNQLALRVDVSSDPTFLELLEAVRETMLGAYQNQDAPFEQVVDALAPERLSGRSPLFSVKLNLQNVPPYEAGAGALMIREMELELDEAKFDLLLTLSETAEGIDGVCEYAAELFDSGTVRGLLSAYVSILERAAANPRARVSHLAEMGDDRHRDLMALGAGPVMTLAHENLVDWFNATAKAVPDRVAVVESDRQITFRVLLERAHALAATLSEMGAGPETLVGICLHRSIDMVVAILGALQAGCSYVPLDPHYPSSRLAHMLDDGAIPILLTSSSLRSSLPSHWSQTICLDTDLPLPSGVDGSFAGPSPRVDQAAYVIYTSGSTGRPKGIAIPHRAICNHMEWFLKEFEIGEHDVILQKTPFSFDASVWEFLAPTLSGAKLVMLEPGAQGDPNAIADAVALHGVTRLQLVPSLAAALVEPAVFRTCGSLRTLFCGGEALNAELARRVWSQHPIEVVNLYGPSEFTIDSVFWRGRHCSRTQLPIGCPVGGVRAYVLDESGRLAYRGAAGELYLGGLGSARGYIRQGALTAERFLPDPFSLDSGSRIYRTGDRVRWLPTGELEFLGRADDQVKIRGFRIEPGEIEATIEQQHRVQRAAVVVREEASGSKRLIAWVEPAGSEPISGTALRDSLRALLPDYMVPSHIGIVPALPLTANGKIDRAALATAELSMSGDADTYDAPPSPVEEQLLAIWRNVLRIEHIGRNDNFFTLGGDSILSVQVVARAQQAGLGVTVRHMFQYQTVAELAAVAQPGVVVEAQQGVVSGTIPLTPVQRRFFAEVTEDRAHFNWAALLLPGKEMLAAALNQAVQRVLTHHDGLRTRFEGNGARIAEKETGRVFLIVDLREAGPAEASCFTAILNSLHRSLALERGPLLRVALIRRPGGDRLLLTVHHLAVDAISWRILIEDFERAYEQAARREPVRLPRKTTSFKQWAEGLIQYTRLKTVGDQEAYWVRMSRTLVPSLREDFAAGQSVLDGEVPMSLGRDETERLILLAAALPSGGIQEILLTGIVEAIYRWTGNDLLRLDLESHGREETLEGLDVSRTVGWFTAVYPVVLERRGTSARERLISIADQMAAVPQRGLGYGLLRYLQPYSPLAGDTTPQICLNYLGNTIQGPQHGDWRLAPEGCGQTDSASRTSPYAFNFQAALSGGRLECVCRYSQERYRPETVSSLATYLHSALVEISELALGSLDIPEDQLEAILSDFVVE